MERTDGARSSGTCRHPGPLHLWRRNQGRRLRRGRKLALHDEPDSGGDDIQFFSRRTCTPDMAEITQNRLMHRIRPVARFKTIAVRHLDRRPARCIEARAILDDIAREPPRELRHPARGACRLSDPSGTGRLPIWRTQSNGARTGQRCRRGHTRPISRPAQTRRHIFRATEPAPKRSVIRDPQTLKGPRCTTDRFRARLGRG